MAAALVNVVFLGLGVVPLAENAIQNAEKNNYKVVVQIGEAGNISTMGGNSPGTSLWTAEGQAIGGSMGGKVIDSGTPFALSFPGNDSLGEGLAQPQYMSVTSGGDDAICVAFITVTQPGDTGEKHVFIADNAAACVDAGQWSYQTVQISGSTPKCIWLDRNYSNGLKFQGMGFHIPSFSNSQDSSKQGLFQQYTDQPETMCDCGPRFRMYEKLLEEDPILFFKDPPAFATNGSDANITEIIGNPGKMADINMELALKACETRGCPNIQAQIDLNPNTNKRRDVPQGKATVCTPKPNTDPLFNPEHLVISHNKAHSAVKLCKDKNGIFTDLVSMDEMKYCHMDTRMLYDVCTDPSGSCCFDLKTQTMRGPCAHHPRIEARAMPNKTYKEVHTWH